MPIKKKSVVQTGAKSQLGGLKLGFSMLSYQVGIEGAVKKEPINPAKRHTKTEAISFVISI